MSKITDEYNDNDKYARKLLQELACSKDTAITTVNCGLQLVINIYHALGFPSPWTFYDFIKAGYVPDGYPQFMAKKFLNNCGIDTKQIIIPDDCRNNTDKIMQVVTKRLEAGHMVIASHNHHNYLILKKCVNQNDYQIITDYLAQNNSDQKKHYQKLVREFPAESFYYVYNFSPNRLQPEKRYPVREVIPEAEIIEYMKKSEHAPVFYEIKKVTLPIGLLQKQKKYCWGKYRNKATLIAELAREQREFPEFQIFDKPMVFYKFAILYSNYIPFSIQNDLLLKIIRNKFHGEWFRSKLNLYRKALFQDNMINNLILEINSDLFSARQYRKIMNTLKNKNKFFLRKFN